MTSTPWSSSTTRTLCRMTPSLLISTMPLWTWTSVPMSRRRKSMAPRSSRPRISGFSSVPRSRARTCALPCGVGDRVGRDEREQPGADVAVDVGLDVLGRRSPVPAWRAPTSAHRRAVDGDRQVLHRRRRPYRARTCPTRSTTSRSKSPGPHADGVGDRHLPAQVRLVQRAARLDARRAGRREPLERAGGAQERLQQLQVEVPGAGSPEIALPSSRPGDLRSPPSVVKCASSRTTRSPLHADVQRARRLDAHPLHGRLAVRRRRWRGRPTATARGSAGRAPAAAPARGRS